MSYTGKGEAWHAPSGQHPSTADDECQPIRGAVVQSRKAQKADAKVLLPQLNGRSRSPVREFIGGGETPSRQLRTALDIALRLSTRPCRHTVTGLENGSVPFDETIAIASFQKVAAHYPFVVMAGTQCRSSFVRWARTMRGHSWRFTMRRCGRLQQRTIRRPSWTTGLKPLTEEAIERVRANPDDEYRLVAEIDGRVVRIGALVVENSELRACYVAPGANRKGVGSALVREMERVARERGLAFLEVDSSITAEPLYAALGYQVRERS